MADAGDEIAEREQPPAEPPKPVLRAIDGLAMALEFRVQHGGIDHPPHGVAQGDAAQASGDGCGRDRRAAEQALSDESAGNGQQELVGNRQAEDAEYLREEQQRRTVACQPGNQLAFQHTDILPYR